MIQEHLPVLQVALPLVAAPLCLLLTRAMWAWLLALAVSVVALGISIVLLREVYTGEVISYAIGGWAAPWGIEYRVDAVNALILIIVTAISTVTLMFAKTSVAQEVAGDKQCLFYTAWLLCLTGLLGIAITGDVFNLFVFLEISSLSSYVLIGLGQDRRALTASFQYLIMGTIGATLILIGIGLLYMVTGTLNMMDLATRLAVLGDSRTVQTGLAFLTVGIGLKLALFPLHLWLPNAYTYAPSAVTVFIAATATKVAVYMLLRFLFDVFDASFTFGAMSLGGFLAVLAAAGILSSSIVSIFSVQHYADVGLFERRAGWLYGAWYQLGIERGSNGRRVTSVQSCFDEGGPFSRTGLCCLPLGYCAPRCHRGPWAAHALDDGRFRCRGTQLNWHPANGWFRQQMVFDPSGGRTRLVASRGGGHRGLTPGYHLCLACGGEGVFAPCTGKVVSDGGPDILVIADVVVGGGECLFRD